MQNKKAFNNNALLFYCRVQFSEALPKDLTMILHCEYPATLYIAKGGKTSASYIPI